MEVLDGDRAKRAGVLRRGAASTTGAVDATVVETTLRRRAAIVTADRGDIELLAAAARRRIQVIDI